MYIIFLVRLNFIYMNLLDKSVIPRSHFLYKMRNIINLKTIIRAYLFNESSKKYKEYIYIYNMKFK